MIRLGIAGATSVTHGYAFAGIFNGYDPTRWAEAGFHEYGNATIPDARVVKVWDADPDKAAVLASLCAIEQVVDRPDQLLEGVDGVIIPDDLSLRHQRLAWPFLEAGIPTFVDKPFAESVEEAKRLVQVAIDSAAPLMSCSALRYARELEEAQLQRLGAIQVASVMVSGTFESYAIHGIELCQAAMGAGVVSVQSIGEQQRDILRLGYADGRSAVVLVFPEIAYVLQLNAYGQKGWAQVTTDDAASFYKNTMQRFVKMIVDRRPPIPYEHTLEIMRVLDAAKRSREGGGQRIDI